MDLVFLLIKNLIPLGAYELREKEIKELTIIEFQKRSNAFDSILNEDLINAGEEKVWFDTRTPAINANFFFIVLRKVSPSSSLAGQWSIKHFIWHRSEMEPIWAIWD